MTVAKKITGDTLTASEVNILNNDIENSENSRLVTVGLQLRFTSEIVLSGAGFYYNPFFTKYAGTVKYIYYKANNPAVVKFGIVTNNTVPTIRDIVEFNVVAGLNAFQVDWAIAANETIGISKTTGDYMTYCINDRGQTNTYIDFESSKVTKQGILPLKFEYQTNIDLIDYHGIVKKNERQTVVIRPEDYGCIPINPFFPDDSMDCSLQFQQLLDDIGNDTKNESFVIELSGIYRLGIDPYWNARHSQLYIPNRTVNERSISIYFKGLTMPLFETQGGTHNVVETIGGCGFYSSWREDTFRDCCVLKSNTGGGTPASVLTNFSYVGVRMDNIAVYINTKDGIGNDVANNMTAINMSTSHHFEFGTILCRTTSPGTAISEPNAGTFGLRTPKIGNHATNVGQYYRGVGFGVGVEAGEHLALNYAVLTQCKVGCRVNGHYPVNINHLCLEYNQIPIEIESTGRLNVGSIQIENYTKLDPVMWYTLIDNIVKCWAGIAGGKMTANMVIAYNSLSDPSEFTKDAGIALRYMMDQSGNSLLV